MFAIQVNDERRIIAASIDGPLIPPEVPRMESIPDGNLSDFLLVDGRYVFDPLPVPPPSPTPTEILEAQVLYTAVMTGTLLED